MMSFGKWLYRYALILSVACLDVVWLVLCANKISQLEAYANSTDFIKLSLDSFKDAVGVLDRIQYYNSLYRNGVIVGIVIAAVFVLLVLWHLSEKRLFGKKSRVVRK